MAQESIGLLSVRSCPLPESTRFPSERTRTLRRQHACDERLPDPPLWDFTYLCRENTHIFMHRGCGDTRPGMNVCWVRPVLPARPEPWPRREPACTSPGTASRTSRRFTAAQSPRRLRSAVFAGADFPIAHSAGFGRPDRRGGLGFHTPRIDDACKRRHVDCLEYGKRALLQSVIRRSDTTPIPSQPQIHRAVRTRY